MPKYVRQSEEIYSKIFQVYGQLKAKNIPGIVRGGGIRYPLPKIFQNIPNKNIPKKIFQHVRVIPGILKIGTSHQIPAIVSTYNTTLIHVYWPAVATSYCSLSSFMMLAKNNK